MAAEIWILLMIIVGAAAAGAGFAYGRRGGPSQADLDAVQQQLDQARSEAAAVQENVTGHFERSALLFGRLAHDYRDFLEHFSESAQELGISEIRARELLERADLPLLGDQRNVIDEQAQADRPDSESAETEPDASTQAASDPTQTADAEIQQADIQQKETDRSAEMEAATSAAAEPSETQAPEPPLMEDVVEPATMTSDGVAGHAEAEQVEKEKSASTSRVVDVDIEGQRTESSPDDRKQA